MSTETFTIHNTRLNISETIEDISNRSNEEIAQLFKDRLRNLNWCKHDSVILGNMGTVIKFIDDDRIDYFSEM